MNERIKELWNKAAKSTAAFPSGQNNSWETQVNFMEKFAELIAKEQIESCRDMFIVGSVSWNLLNEKLEHFGVEEPPVCKHDWYSAKNQVVLNGSVCVICGAIDPREPEELKNESRVSSRCA